MSELNYSKKQIQPIIDKFGINPSTNTVFGKIISMFNGAPNYQLWGVKVVFNKSITMSQLEGIKTWADNNHELIKMLKKNGNIISYTTKEDFAQLFSEMEGLLSIQLVKNVIATFNTKQRKLLYNHLKMEKMDGLTAPKSTTFRTWFGLLSKFAKMPLNRRIKVTTRLSPTNDVQGIKNIITEALKEKYIWEKEDLLRFVDANTPKCKIIFNEGDVVILEVTSYKDSNTLCLSRTSWCITSSEDQWNHYVKNPGNHQYFLFDFSKEEEDELAHVGFTVSNDGFTAAHSTKDVSLLHDFKYKDKETNIQKVLKGVGVNLSCFLKLKNGNFKWDKESFLSYAKNFNSSFETRYDKNNRMILEIKDYATLNEFCCNTFINKSNVPFNPKSKVFLLLDFNLEQNDDQSIVLITYAKDAYGIDTLNSVYDAFGTNIKSDNYLSKISIKREEYLPMPDIDPGIMLHKLIDEGDENAVIEFMDNNSKINVNYAFNDKVPIFSAIDAKMDKVVAKIIMDDKFDGSTCDSFGESLIQNMLFSYYCDDTYKPSENVLKTAENVITIIVDSNKFDLNYADYNEDTAINIACTKPNMLWLVKKLAANKNINVNCVNDIGFAALGNAIRKKNIKAIEILGKRPDLIVRNEDKKLAKEMNIDLDKYIKPEPFHEITKTTVSESVVESVIDAEKYSELFKKVFSMK